VDLELKREANRRSPLTYIMPPWKFERGSKGPSFGNTNGSSHQAKRRRQRRDYEAIRISPLIEEGVGKNNKSEVKYARFSRGEAK